MSTCSSGVSNAFGGIVDIDELMLVVKRVSLLVVYDPGRSNLFELNTRIWDVATDSRSMQARIAMLMLSFMCTLAGEINHVSSKEDPYSLVDTI